MTIFASPAHMATQLSKRLVLIYNSNNKQESQFPYITSAVPVLSLIFSTFSVFLKTSGNDEHFFMCSLASHFPSQQLCPRSKVLMCLSFLFL